MVHVEQSKVKKCWKILLKIDICKTPKIRYSSSFHYCVKQNKTKFLTCLIWWSIHFLVWFGFLFISLSWEDEFISSYTECKMPMSYPAEYLQQTIGNIGLEISSCAKRIGCIVIKLDQWVDRQVQDNEEKRRSQG